VIDGATNQALATLPAGRRPYALAVDPGSSKLYVANAAGEKVFTVVDTSGIPGARQ
jgi:DNA-binding beta-propeller fold protein YncE